MEKLLITLPEGIDFYDVTDFDDETYGNPDTVYQVEVRYDEERE